jgi:hypothetical protein
MHRKLIAVMLSIAVLAVPLALSFAQESQPGETGPQAPLFVRFCEDARRARGEEEFRTVLTTASGLVEDLQISLDAFNRGNLTFLEGIAQAEVGLGSWDAVLLDDCMAALDTDMGRVMSEVLAAMLYGQLTRTDESTSHLNNAGILINTLRAGIEEANTWLDTPLADLDAIPTAEPTVEGEVTAEPTEEATGLRDASVLNPLLSDELLDNGISLLREVNVQISPTGIVVVVNIDRLTGGDAETDMANTIFTYDQLGEILLDWPELTQVNTLIINTYDETGAVVLTASAIGENFRNHYVNNVMTAEEFIAFLAIQTSGVAPASTPGG